MATFVACGDGDGEDSPPQDEESFDGGVAVEDAGDTEAPDAGSPDSGQPVATSTFQLPFVYSGYDGTNTYEARFIFGSTVRNAAALGVDVTAVQASVEDPSIADLVRVDMGPQGPRHFVLYTVTTRAAGTTRIITTYQGNTVFSDLTVYAYTPQDVQVGSTRYSNPPNPNADRVPCSNCHFVGGIQHSPDYTAFWSEQQALEVVTQGSTTLVFQDGNTVTYDPEPNGLPHAWNLTPEEEAGIMAYMRSLPLLDFGP